MTIPELQAEPIGREIPLKRAGAKPVNLRKKLLLVVPLPIAGYLVVRAISLGSTTAGDPVADLANSLVRGLLYLGAVACLFLSARGFFAIRCPRD